MLVRPGRLLGRAAVVAAEAVSVTDDFNRADGALSGNWTQLVGGQNVVISSNEVGSDTAGSYSTVLWNANEFAADQYSQAVVRNAADSFGLAIRGQIGEDRQHFGCRSQFGQFHILSQNSSTITVIATELSPPTFDVGDVLRMEATGNVLRVLHNGVEFMSVEDATYPIGAPGIHFPVGTTARLDDWEGGPIV